jgi:hypothetical protein
MFVYDGGVLDATRTAEIHLAAEELRGWAWCTVEPVRERMTELLARRVAAALWAQADGVTSYLESGHPTA